jgi:hypothetical protein
VIYSSPIVADVLPDNPGPEIIIESGCYFPQNTNNKRGKWIKILRPSDGAVLQTLDLPSCASSTPAVGDIDGDGQLEIVATTNGSRSMGGDGLSRVMAWKATNNTPLWSTAPADRGTHDPYGGNFKSPVIADVDGNGSLEVIASYFDSIQIFDGKSGAPLTCQSQPCTAPVLPTFSYLSSTPAVGDVNGDGILDIVAAGGHGRDGQLYGFTNLANVLSTAPGTLPPFSAPWPTYRGNAQHTAIYP